ncbi:uncharacterized protein [Diabrotica undecimpunctata]|uniref:uncharacterized protein n=1 Tax=Diabrotica undecimpunctata TaxID=50387 RepID=UPI003B63A24A
MNTIVLFVVLSIAVSASAQTERTLHMLVKVRNVESGQLVGVDTANQGRNMVYAREGLQYYDWILEPDCFPNTNAPSYHLRLAANTNFRWNHARECRTKNTEVIIYNLGTETKYNNYFRYDPQLETITVCDSNCVYVDPTSQELKSSNRCENRNDKFEILFQGLADYTSTSQVNLDCFQQEA